MQIGTSCILLMYSKRFTWCNTNNLLFLSRSLFLRDHVLHIHIYLLYAIYSDSDKQMLVHLMPKFDIYFHCLLVWGSRKLYHSEFWQETDGILKRSD